MNTNKELFEEFKKWVEEDDFPCLMAKGVFIANNVLLRDFGDDDKQNIKHLSQELIDYLERYKKLKETEFASFIAVFSNVQPKTELEFEEKLFSILYQLSTIDPKEWDEKVSSDPRSNLFSYSHNGQAFYIIGMHPNSSRKARRFSHFAIVFNLHNQFEQLRKMGVYEDIRDKIRARDEKYSGSVNPMVKDFGKSSESRQYSGRDLTDEPHWICPHFAKRFEEK